MATKKPTGDQSTVEVRIIDFKLTGSDDALRESLQTISNAFGRQNVHVNRQLATSPAVSLPNNKPDAQTELNDAKARDDHIQDVQPRAPSIVRKPAKPAAVKVLDGINFTDTTPTLKDFYDQKNPSSDLSKYLVVAYWYKNYRGISDLTQDHFHTAFRALKVATPKNALQPIRDLRNSRNGKFTGGTDKGTCTIHHIGETFVEEMGKGG